MIPRFFVVLDIFAVLAVAVLGISIIASGVAWTSAPRELRPAVVGRVLDLVLYVLPAGVGGIGWLYVRGVL